MHLTILYFAQLAEEAGKPTEHLTGKFNHLADVYANVQQKYGLSLSTAQLRVARNLVFAQWQDAPEDGDEIAFIPPVSGG